MHQWDSGMSLPTDFTEIVIHCLPCSEIRGKHSPLHAGLHDVQDAVKNRAQRIFSESFFGVQHIFYNLPLFISQVGWVFVHNINVLITLKL